MRPRSPKLSSKVLTNIVQYLFFAPPNSLKNVFQPSGFPGSSVNISLFISLIVSYPFLASKKSISTLSARKNAILSQQEIQNVILTNSSQTAENTPKHTRLKTSWHGNALKTSFSFASVHTNRYLYPHYASSHEEAPNVPIKFHTYEQRFPPTSHRPDVGHLTRRAGRLLLYFPPSQRTVEFPH